jgi:GH25 family lysozyme M1 (1,4-beta-N-acetylmuramidase)
MHLKVSTAAPATAAARHYFFFFFAAFLAGAFLAAFFAALAILDRPSVWIIDGRNASVDPTQVESFSTLITFKTMHKRNLMFGDIENIDR